ncbi:FAD-binding oxidoreductase [Paraburkholderia heleia]|uniref:FAD-binding oxidoreductase n=1 Tax=Paraburkholderia heleia TaxID=634127 RepID=UPI0006938DE8|nr:FAD-binding protein [Paraburkholderia heleia]
MNPGDLPRQDICALLALQRRLAGNTRAEVRFDSGTRAAYASEASNYRQVPIGIVVPRTIEDVVETMRACREADVPVLTRGAHSVMAGKTAENIETLEVLTYDGEQFWVGPPEDAALREHLAAGGRRAEIVPGLVGLVERYGDVIREGFPKLKRRVSGYNLDQLLPENGFDIALRWWDRKAPSFRCCARKPRSSPIPCIA